jgi:hypothetical protein
MAFPPPEKHGREYAEKLVQAVIARRRQVAEQFYGMGMELRELSRPEMYRGIRRLGRRGARRRLCRRRCGRAGRGP